jgi:hypothetical protein
VATAHNNLGLVLKDLGDVAGARAAFKRALGILERSQLPPDHAYIKSLKDKLMFLDFQEKLGEDGLAKLLESIRERGEAGA